jgi:hypothetical protein
MMIVRHQTNGFRLGVGCPAADQDRHMDDRAHHPRRDGANQHCHPPWRDHARCRQTLVGCVPGDGQGEQCPGESAGKSFRVRVVPS